jgi:hypothetical protein
MYLLKHKISAVKEQEQEVLWAVLSFTCSIHFVYKAVIALIRMLN